MVVQYCPLFAYIKRGADKARLLGPVATAMVDKRFVKISPKANYSNLNRVDVTVLKHF